MGKYARRFLVLYTALAAGCGGDIVFGNSRGDAGVQPVDTGPLTQPDTGPAPYDAGMPVGMDASPGMPAS
jgi:hypothetical protein